jgi:hypothetical protein
MILDRSIFLTGVAAISLLVSGCSGSKVAPEYPVKGTVTLDGSPMTEGDIYFIDTATSTSSVLPVTNGQFAGKSEAGTFKVEINQFREETVQADPTGYTPPGNTTKKNIVLPEFNAKSTLKAEVTASGPNEFSFDAKSK